LKIGLISIKAVLREGSFCSAAYETPMLLRSIASGGAVSVACAGDA
jgi:hypothetical protein